MSRRQVRRGATYGFDGHRMRRLAIALVAACVAPGATAAAQASTVTVSAFSDGNGSCAGTVCTTLRAAVDAIDTGAFPPGSTIQLNAGTYTIVSYLPLSAAMTVNGTGTPGAGGTAIKETGAFGPADNVLAISNTSGLVTVSNVEITGGENWQNTIGEATLDAIGGGIYVAAGADAQLTGDLVDDNVARGSVDGNFAMGGGIATAGTLTISATTVTNNGAQGGGGVQTEQSPGGNVFGGPGVGGGIDVLAGSLTVNDGSVISGNTAGGGPGGSDQLLHNKGGTAGGAFGGGIANLGANEVTADDYGLTAGGTITVTDSMIEGNHATGGAGGGAFATSGGQGGLAFGAGVYSGGAGLTVTASTIAANVATGGGGGAGDGGRPDGGAGESDGGGIDIVEGTAMVSGDTFTGNSAVGGAPGGSNIPDGSDGGATGGGVAMAVLGNGVKTPLAIVNSTFVGNSVTEAVSPASTGSSALVAGGGLFMYNGAAASDTFDANAATGPAGSGGNVAGSGGKITGVLIADGSATINPNCYSYTSAFVFGLTDGGNNLEDSGAGISQCGLRAISHDQLIAPGAAGLEPLAANGGPTQTVALTPGSPAIGAGAACVDPTNNWAALTVDQRGLPRPAGACDIGAYQSQGGGGGGGGGGSGGGGGGGGGGGPAPVPPPPPPAPVPAPAPAPPTAGGGAAGAGGSSGSGGPPADGAGVGSGHAPLSAAKVIDALGHDLAPSGGEAHIARVIKAGGFVFRFDAPSAGTAVVDWYELSSAARTSSGRSHRKPVLVASARTRFGSAGAGNVAVMLTRAGRKLLAHARSVSLRAVGSFTPNGSGSIRTTRTFKLKR